MLFARRSSASVRERIPLAAIVVSWSIDLPDRMVQFAGRAKKQTRALAFPSDEKKGARREVLRFGHLSRAAAKFCSSPNRYLAETPCFHLWRQKCIPIACERCFHASRLHVPAG
jgi:hypothetical protein